MAYATVDDVQRRITRQMTEQEERICEALLEDTVYVINAYNRHADEEVKRIVSINMVKRLINMGDDLPIGTSQGSVAALGYSQSFTLGSGASAGELYLTKLDKKMLGASNHIGSRSPLEECNDQRDNCCSL